MWAWKTTMETNWQLLWTELPVALRALKQLHGEQPFELRKLKGPILQIMQQWESASLHKGQKSTQDEEMSTSSDPKWLSILTVGSECNVP